MSETLDAEDVTEIMNALWKRLDQIILDHGGYIDKHIGDAVMAIWGAEVALENDPEQAIRTGLEMQTELADFREIHGVELAMRVGINTGSVLLGEVGTTKEFTAIGDAVNVASRLEGAAPVGGVLISHVTYRHVRGLFDLIALDPISLKGKAELMQVYQIEEARRRGFRVATRGVEGVETRMIGRETELKALQDAFHTAVQNQECGLVTIVGEAGLGKSRLLYEFENWVDIQPETVTIFKARARLETQGTPYGLLRDLFAFQFDIHENDPIETLRSKLTAGLGEIIPGDDSEMKSHFIAQLIGYNFQDSYHLKGILSDPQQIRDRGWMYLTDFFTAICRQSPTIILLEDLHWADDTSLDTFIHLMKVLSGQPLLLIGATRPEFYNRHPDWDSGHTGHQRLNLAPLSARNGRQLVSEVLQKVAEVPDSLMELVIINAEGNPFYVEELIKMLMEDGVITQGERWTVQPEKLVDMQVPSTLAGVLQARLDSLSLSDRQVIQQAAVVGHIFWDASLLYLNQSTDSPKESPVSDALMTLQNREFIFQRQTSKFTGTAEHIFKHMILREVTYESVLRRVRRTYHAAVADWLIERSGERIREYTGLIADHLEHAGKIEKAIEFFHRAGKIAYASFAIGEAIQYYTRALILTPETDLEKRWVLLLAREEIYHLSGQRENQVADLKALAVLADTLETADKQPEVLLRQAYYAERTKDYRTFSLVDDPSFSHTDFVEQTRKHLLQALALVKKTGFHVLAGRVLHQLGNIASNLGDTTTATGYFQQALAVSREQKDTQTEKKSLASLGYMKTSEGNFGAAKDYAQKRLHISQTTDDLRDVAETNFQLGVITQAYGDYEAAQQHYEEALMFAQTAGVRPAVTVLPNQLGWLAMHRGDFNTAQDFIEEAIANARSVMDKQYLSFHLTRFGNLLTQQGRLTEARAAYQEGLELSEAVEQVERTINLRAGFAKLALAQGALDEAQILIEQNLALILDPANISNSKLVALDVLPAFLTCIQVLQTTQDPRAMEVLDLAYRKLQETAAQNDDKAIRKSLLENVPWNREIIMLWNEMHA